MAEWSSPTRVRLGFGLPLLVVLATAGCVGLWPTSTTFDPSPVAVPAARGVAEVLPSAGRGGKYGTFPTEVIDVCGKEREYRLVVPLSVDLSRPVPLVFAFHGIFEGKDYMPGYSHLDGLADAHGFILVYPEGKDKCWPLALDWTHDDVAFFDALYAHLTSQYNIDLNRVYVTGMSNGAYFSHFLALQRSDRIAAIAVHSGGLGLLAFSDVPVKRKYPVLIIHGDADTVVAVEEGRRARDAYQRWGWDRDLEYVELPGHPHLWAYDLGINERIWKFFMDHPRK
jgi:poly(3-hydroxybutyrate) depolymerase